VYHISVKDAGSKYGSAGRALRGGRRYLVGEFQLNSREESSFQGRVHKIFTKQ